MGFVSDDQTLLLDNQAITGSDGLGALWTSDRQSDYFPLTLTSFWIEWRLWRDGPFGYHHDKAWAHASMVNLHYDQGRRGEARRHYLEAIRLEPNNPLVPRLLLRLADMDLDLHSPELAVIRLRQLLGDNPHFAEAHQLMVMALMTSGRPEIALTHHVLRIRSEGNCVVAQLLQTASDLACKVTAPD